MPAIETNKEFFKVLSSLSLEDQRRVGVKFIDAVLDLANDEQIKNIISTAENSDIFEDGLSDAYRLAHSIYIKSQPHLDMTEMNYDRQAGTFVAEAAMVCVSPTFREATVRHLAQKVASYCRMARTCSSLSHDDENPDFSNAEKVMAETTQEQFSILSDFLS